MSHKDLFAKHRKEDRSFCDRFAKQKNGMDYIPWAIMWSAVQAAYDGVEVVSTVDHHEGVTGCEVTVRVRLRLGEKVSEWTQSTLAVTDFRNKTLTAPESADVQNTRQRALAKALSMASGIGLSLWFGDIQAPRREAA